MRESHASQRTDIETLKAAAREMVAGMTATLAANTLGPLDKRQRLQSTGWFDHRANVQQPGAGHRLALVLEMCLNLGLDQEVELLLAQVEETASCSDPPTLHLIMIPFLGVLAKVSQTHAISLTNRRYQKVFKHVIANIVKVYVGVRPIPPPSWSLVRVLKAVVVSHMSLGVLSHVQSRTYSRIIVPAPRLPRTED